MKNGSILIISNDETTGKTIESKVKLLRECDNVQVVSYIEAISVLNSSQPAVIMVYGSGSESISVVKEIRTLKYLDKVPIILVLDYFIEDIVLYAFDNGIDDFFFLNDSDAIILMRVILALQKSILYKQLDITNEVLVTLGVIDRNSGIYTKEKAPFILKAFFSKSIEENEKDTVFMCIKPVSNQQKKVNIQSVMQAIENIIRNIPRGNDIVTYGKNSTFYLILYNAGINGAKSVANRIKGSLSSEYDIYATAAEITTSFEEMEPVLIQSLKDQISAGIEFNFLYNLNVNEAAEVLDIHDESGKKFKDFKKEFYNELEKLIAPVFYEMQKKASDMFNKSSVNFDITETKSNFNISCDDIKSELTITYPSYMKLLVDIKHTTGEKRPRTKRLSFDVDEFSSDKLLSLIEDMLKEFAITINTEKNE